MHNTYTQIHIHAIFAVQNRISLISKPYGAFSYSKSQIPAVATYTENQELHHRKKTFIEEYTKILQDFEIEFDEKYIFKPITD